MASTLHVLLYYPAQLPVQGYGGTERVVGWLARGLAEHGVTVSLVAYPGTVVPEARLIPIDPAVAERPGGVDLTPYLPSGVDVVHAHVPVTPLPADVPFLWTFHGNAKPGRIMPDTAVGLSADHARRHTLARWVHNGLDPADYTFQASASDRDLFLGRLHRVKGWQWAVNGARRAGRSITVAGGWRPSLRPGVRFVGRVGGERKRQLLADAACLWVPAQWEEPFGLTTIEAMVSGTPVLGTRRGALPEVISHASGAMGDTLQELVSLRAGLDQLDRTAVRQHVLDHFTHRTMAANYMHLYEGLINKD